MEYDKFNGLIALVRMEIRQTNEEKTFRQSYWRLSNGQLINWSWINSDRLGRKKTKMLEIDLNSIIST